jgi:FtsZ-interacting cell division protein ZipA
METFILDLQDASTITPMGNMIALAALVILALWNFKKERK